MQPWKLRHFRRRGSRARAYDVCGPRRSGSDIASRNPIGANGHPVQQFNSSRQTTSTACKGRPARYEQSCRRRLDFENKAGTRYLSRVGCLIGILQVQRAVAGGPRSAFFSLTADPLCSSRPSHLSVPYRSSLASDRRVKFKVVFLPTSRHLSHRRVIVNILWCVC
ncbi:hypothetical protein LSAT2_008368, partial [Lamellibrachia satsuma]